MTFTNSQSYYCIADILTEVLGHVEFLFLILSLKYCFFLVLWVATKWKGDHPAYVRLQLCESSCIRTTLQFEKYVLSNNTRVTASLFIFFLSPRFV